MLSEFDLFNIILSAFAIMLVSIFSFFLYLRSKNITGKARVVATTKFNVCIYIFFCFILWFSLPSTAVLKSFGYPNGIEDIATDEKILDILQEYNSAIARTTDVLYNFIFFTAVWLISNFFTYTRLSKIKDEE